MTTRKVAIVTGANKGIGYEIVKGLCKRFDGDVYLTSRNSTKGQEAVNKLKELGFNPLFHQLDIANQSSVDNLKNYIKEKHGGIDILINNAGVYANQTLPIVERAEQDIGVNYYGTLKICNALFPLLRENAKVVNVSSSAGRLHRIPSKEIQDKLKDPNLTIENLSKLVETYLKSVKENTHIADGWHENSYHVSKVALSALSIIQQRLFDLEKPNRNISLNFVHPGWIQTGMNQTATGSAEQGAKSSLFAALDANVKGQYIWHDCSVVDWTGPEASRY